MPQAFLSRVIAVLDANRKTAFVTKPGSTRKTE
jgi:hypothetical protein